MKNRFMNSFSESDSCYCTLFNSFYLDRGVVMLRSLAEHAGAIRIYVLAMDEDAFAVLNQLCLDKVILIRHIDFETEELLELKEERTIAEYCWTCTGRLIEYIFENYKELICTYIDADLFFYQNPFCLIEEMIQNQCCVQIIEHRFGKGVFARHMRRYSGVYCVQFNTFVNINAAKVILKEWIRQCTVYCSSTQDGKTLGDQKYLEDWPLKYKCVHVLENEGGGVAPWNIHLYRLKAERHKHNVKVQNKHTKKLYEVVFYHFHSLRLKENGITDICVYTRNLGIDKKLVDFFYKPYIYVLKNERKRLRERFGISFGMACEEKKKIKQKAYVSMKFSEFVEKLYCRIRAIFMEARKKKDFL